MKPFARLLFFPFLFSILTLLSVGAEDKAPTLVKVSDDDILIDGDTFDYGPQVRDLETLWGKPDRFEKLANDIRIWDVIGVRSYSQSGDPFVDSLSFTMKKQDFKLAAKSVFQGKIELPKGAITNQTTSADLKALGFEQHEILSKMYKLELVTASFLAEVDESDGSLVTISMTFAL